MNPKEFRYFAEKVKSEFKSFLNNCYTEFTEVDLETSKGQVFTLDVFYSEEYLDSKGCAFDNNDLVRPIMYFQAKGDWANYDLDINKFFRINDQIFEEFSELSIRGELDFIIPLLKEGISLSKPKFKGQSEVNTYLFLSINSQVCTGDQYIKQLLDEGLAAISLNEQEEGKIEVACVMSVRNQIKTLINGQPIKLSVPYEKVDNFKVLENKTETFNIDEKYVFVAMSFQSDPILEDSYTTIKRSVRRLKKSLICERVNDIAEDFIITDKIIDCIKRAKVVIFDLTGNRPNVYYELGYARALGKNIIITAHEGEKPHFDVTSQNIIFYKNSTSLENSLVTRLRTIFK